MQNDFILTVEGDVGAFLGIDIKRRPDGKLELLQPGHIKKIIADYRLQDGTHTHTRLLPLLLSYREMQMELNVNCRGTTDLSSAC
jgi:hypothetical protein